MNESRVGWEAKLIEVLGLEDFHVQSVNINVSHAQPIYVAVKYIPELSNKNMEELINLIGQVQFEKTTLNSPAPILD